MNLVLSLLFSITFLWNSTAADSSDFNVLLLNINLCNNQLTAKAMETISAQQFLKLQMGTTNPSKRIPNWLKTICNRFDCFGKVFKISNCKNVDVAICYSGVVCNPLSNKQLEQEKPDWLKMDKSKDNNNNELVQPWWFPNDKIM